MRISKVIIGLLQSLSLLSAPSTSFQPPPRRHDVGRHVASSSSSSSSSSSFTRGRSPLAPVVPPIRDIDLFDGGTTSGTALDAFADTADVVSAIASPVGSVSVLAFVILVHEAGHFLAARTLGMRVDEFSVGVGPRLLGMRRRPIDGGGYVLERIVDVGGGGEGGDEDGIEFSLRAVPLGGYVRFPENYNRTLAFEGEDLARRARNEARSMRIEGSTPVERALEYMAAASFVLNVASLGSLKRWQTRRVEEQLRRAEEEMKESRSNKFGKNRNDASWWNVLPWVANKKNVEDEVGSSGDEYDKLAILRAAASDPIIDYYDDPNLLQNRPWHQRAIVLSGGVVFNILLAFACYFGELSWGRGLPSPVFERGAVVSESPGKDSPSYGLLRQGDVILSVNDVIGLAPAADFDSKPGVWASQREISNVISTIRETPDGESVKLTIVHGRNNDGMGKTDEISVYPRRNTDGLASIGVMLSPNYKRTDMIRASSVVDAMIKAGTAVYDLTSETARSIFGLLIGILFGKGVPVGTSMSGEFEIVLAALSHLHLLTLSSSRTDRCGEDGCGSGRDLGHMGDHRLRGLHQHQPCGRELAAAAGPRWRAASVCAS
jgi:membrane-associated protease RseP (regulator of RpoE activity)